MTAPHWPALEELTIHPAPVCAHWAGLLRGHTTVTLRCFIASDGPNGPCRSPGESHPTGKHEGRSWRAGGVQGPQSHPGQWSGRCQGHSHPQGFELKPDVSHTDIHTGMSQSHGGMRVTGCRGHRLCNGRPGSPRRAGGLSQAHLLRCGRVRGCSTCRPWEGLLQWCLVWACSWPRGSQRVPHSPAWPVPGSPSCPIACLHLRPCQGPEQQEPGPGALGLIHEPPPRATASCAGEDNDLLISKHVTGVK